jgi:CBS domain containing-hemolysin-like protein
MTERGAQEIAIIDEAGILAGVVTPTDVARALAGRVRRGSAA